MKKGILIIFIISYLFSCDKPFLNGHYHVEWGNRTSFQTWNIKNNRIRINDSVCNDEKEICFGKKIEFKGDSIFVPWVDNIYAAKYKIKNNGTIILTTTIYSNKLDTLKLIPKENCITSKAYFRKKQFPELINFNLFKTYINSGKSVFPNKYENELIVVKKNGKPVYIFNDRKITFNENKKGFGIEKNPIKSNLWITVDDKVKLIEITDILKEVFDKGYKIYFSQKETENDEQIIVFKKSITNITIVKDKLILNVCEYCNKHPTKKLDSVLKYKIYDLDSCLVNNKITDFFQLRNYTSRFLGQNRTTRLNTKIELEINANILFKDYLEVMNELDFVNTELSSITYYHGINDPDQKHILEKQNSLEPNQLYLEFPLRMKEIIYPF